jgi:uncharacterized protein (TIGR02145 family)
MLFLKTFGWQCDEWMVLIDLLDGSNVAGGKMKTTTHWNSPNTGATNISGFSGLPGGIRSYTVSDFRILGEVGDWWTLTEVNPTNARHYYIFYNSASIIDGTNNKSYGLSTRCIKNESTQQNLPPSLPSNPTPESGSINQPTTPTLTWSCSDPEGDPLTYDVYFGTDANPPLVVSGTTEQTHTPATLEYSTTYYWKIFAHDDQGNSTEGEVWSFTTLPLFEWQCGDILIDSRDDQEYATVQIGEQCWMAKNLAYLPEVSPSSQGSTNDPYYYVYDYQGSNVIEAKATENYTNYGVFYNWPASLSACPDGWYLPADSEFCSFAIFLDPSYNCNAIGYSGSTIGGQTKVPGTIEDGTGLWYSPNTGANNQSGFSALPSGQMINHTFQDQGYRTIFWNSSLRNGFPLHFHIHYDTASVSRGSTEKSLGYSIRCLRD